MKNFHRYTIGWIKSAVESLAFLPLPIMLGGILLGCGLFYVELNTDVSTYIKESVPAIVVSSQDTARTILGIMIGGLITLTVFTFTQMMSLFSQVAASYSPRLLPYLTGSSSLQFVMGTYLAVIVTSTIVLVSIRGSDKASVPVLSVTICIALSIMCLMLFLYFVTTISNKIQADKIIESVYKNGVEAIKNSCQAKNFEEKKLPDDLEDWHTIPSPIGGFIGTINYNMLSGLAKEYNTCFYIGAARGQYLPKNSPLLQSERRINPDQIKKVLAVVSPNHRKYNDWHLPNIRLLTEIAVKSMSPGINDPGSAIDVLDRLSALLARVMALPGYNYFRAEGGGEVYFSRYSFGDVLTGVMQELRQYCKADVLVMRRLFKMLNHLDFATGDHPDYRHLIREEIMALVEDARKNIHNSKDRRVIAREIITGRRKTEKLFENTNFLLNDDFLLERGTWDNDLFSDQ